MEKIIRALDSDIRRRILSILRGQQKTVLEILKDLRKEGFEVKYRETIYRAVEMLLGAGLVSKGYVKGKGLCYKASVEKIILNLADNTATVLP